MVKLRGGLESPGIDDDLRASIVWYYLSSQFRLS
jgi:hypothetical protein